MTRSCTVITGLACALALSCAMLASLTCSRAPGLRTVSEADSSAIVEDNVRHRAEMDVFFRSDSTSPFVRDTASPYHGIRWFPVDVRFCVTSVLHPYEAPETVIVMGTKGERRHQLKYGYFEFALPDVYGNAVPVRLNAYKFTPSDSQRYARYQEALSVWFTDSTTGIATYAVGRYVDVGDDAHDERHLYTIDFNKAYNPYCAYSTLYSCAVPRKEDHIPVAVRAGEMNYHDGDMHP